MYARNNNSGYVAGDPNDYLYMDIDEANSGNKQWLTYDEMRKEASGIKYDCFTDETCYGYNWEYDMEHYIPALKEYADKTFYNRYKGEVDFFDMFKQYVSYGDYPDFEDDEWWDTENEIINEGETKYNYGSNIVDDTGEFEEQIRDVLLLDNELKGLADDCAVDFEGLCENIAFDLVNSNYNFLLRDNVVSPAYRITVDGNQYNVDADLVWEIANYYCET